MNANTTKQGKIAKCSDELKTRRIINAVRRVRARLLGTANPLRPADLDAALDAIGTGLGDLLALRTDKSAHSEAAEHALLRHTLMTTRTLIERTYGIEIDEIGPPPKQGASQREARDHEIMALVTTMMEYVAAMHDYGESDRFAPFGQSWRTRDLRSSARERTARFSEALERAGAVLANESRTRIH